MSKRDVKAEHDYSKSKSKEKPKSPFERILKGLSKAQADNMAKHSK